MTDPLYELNDQLRKRSQAANNNLINTNQDTTGNTSGSISLETPTPKQINSFYVDPSNNDLDNVLDQLDASMAAPIPTASGGFQYK